MSIANAPPEKLATFHAMHESAIGIDVHSKMLVAAYQRSNFLGGTIDGEIRQSRTFMSDLKNFAEWCKEKNPEVILFESTGPYWYSLCNALEQAGFARDEIVVLNARDCKNLTGRKTDTSDAIHLAEVGRSGNFRPSFILGYEGRQTRLLYRDYVKDIKSRASLLNRIHKDLAFTGCRASAVFSDLRGKAARSLIEALVYGLSGEALRLKVEDVCAKIKNLKHKPDEIFEALSADMKSPAWAVIEKNMELVRKYDENIDVAYNRLKNRLQPYWRLVELLMSIPGIGEKIAIAIVAELGDDLSSFPNIRKFARWIGLAPGNNESAGKKYSTKITHGNPYLRSVLIEAACAISHMVGGYLKELHQTLKERRGYKRANVAIAHKIARIIFSIYKNQQPYEERPRPVLKIHRLGRLQKDVSGLKDVGLSCDNIDLVETETGKVTVIAGTETKKRRGRKPKSGDTVCPVQSEAGKETVITGTEVKKRRGRKPKVKDAYVS